MASTKIRGITIDLNADATGIMDGLKDVNKSIKETQGQLKDVDKLLNDFVNFQEESVEKLKRYL